MELRQARASGADRLVLTPGNYGTDFLDRWDGAPAGVPRVRCSNFLGEALDMAAAEGFSAVVLVSHAGKLVKVAGGVMNTHSRWADARLETLAASLILAGGEAGTAAALLGANTTEEALDIRLLLFRGGLVGTFTPEHLHAGASGDVAGPVDQLAAVSAPPQVGGHEPYPAHRSG